MAKYSRGEIEAMAVIAGWGRHARDASWVAMAESSGDSSIVNSIGCVGLLQINQPVHVKAHPTWTVKWLQVPTNNLRAGKILFDGSGQKWDGPWLDSRDKGGLPTGNGGWGQHVKGSGGGATQVDDDPCELLPEGQARDYCERDEGDTGTPLDEATDAAEQLGRIAQAIAKGANWIADPANWVRVVYVVGGGVLTVAAVNVIARPAIAPAVQAVGQVIPTKTYRRVRNARRANQQKAGATP